MATTPQQIQYMMQHPHQTLHPNIIASTSAGLALAYVAVALRLLARYKSKMGFGMDDWLIVAAALFFMPYTICTIYGDHGDHIIFVRSPRTFVVTFIAAIVAYSITTALTKISILCFYCRIFPSKTLRHVAVGISVWTIAYNVALCLVVGLMCIPISSLWTQKPGKCIETLPPFLTLGIVNVVTDFAILTIPVRYVMRLQMNPLKKLQVCAIFLTGALVCVFGIVRVVALATAAPGDPSYNQAWSGIWSACEATIGIVAACLPTMGLFFVKSKSFSSSISSSIRKLVSPLRTRSRDSSKGSSGRHNSEQTLTGEQSEKGSTRRNESGFSGSETSIERVKQESVQPPAKATPAQKLLNVFIPSYRLHRENVQTDKMTLSAVRDHEV